MTSDDDRRAQPAVRAHRGTGMNMLFLCWKCNKPKDSKGSKVVKRGPLRMKICAACCGG